MRRQYAVTPSSAGPRTLPDVRLRRRRKLMLVTGGSGFLGRHITGTDASKGWQIYAPGSRLLDVRDPAQVNDEVRGWRPDVVVHLAYRKEERVAVVDSAVNMARAAAKARARFIHVSTDQVFRGGAHAYSEEDLVSPVGEYGTWKAQAEEAILSMHDDALIVRTSLLYGTSIIAPIQHDVAAVLRGQLKMRFFTDEIRCPAHAGDVARGICSLAGRGSIDGIIHIAGPQPVSRAELARRFARWMGFDPREVPTGTATASPVPRAGRLVLDSGKAAALGIRCRSLDEVLGI